MNPVARREQLALGLVLWFRDITFIGWLSWGARLVMRIFEGSYALDSKMSCVGPFALGIV